MSRRYGLDFSYATWTPDTKLTFTNVTWDSQGNNVVNFGTRANLDAFIDSVPGRFNMQFAKTDRVTGVIDVDMLYIDAQRYNYIRATNNVQSAIEGDRTTSFYYFILGVEFVATHTTRLILQRDVWHTYLEEFSFGNCFIEQGHLGVAASNSFEGYGRKHLTIPEGLETGASMVTVATVTDKIITTVQTPTEMQLNAYVMVAATQNLKTGAGTVDDPKIDTAEGSKVQLIMSGVEYYVFRTMNDFRTFMQEMSATPWASQSIVSISLIPRLERYMPSWTWATVPSIHATLPPHSFIPSRVAQLGANWRSKIDAAIPAKFSHLHKFKTYPYSMVEMTTLNGQSIAIRPEQWNNANGNYSETISILPPAQRVSFSPIGYNAARETSAPVGSGSADDGADFLDMAVHITNFPSTAMVNNGALTVLASNAASISYGYESVQMMSERSRRGADAAYSQASNAAATQNALNALGNQGIRDNRSLDQAAANSQTWLNTGESLLNLQLGSAIMGHAQNATTQHYANQAAELAIRQNNDANTITGANADYVRDSNKALADYYIQNDAAASIGALNAKVRDMQSIPPSIVGQVGGEFFNTVNNLLGVSFRIKTIDAGNMERIGLFWCRYGYAMSHWRVLGTPSDLAVMTKFSYWKVQEVNMRASTVLEADKNVIRGQMSRGVTIWEDPADIGMIDLTTNRPKAGITL